MLNATLKRLRLDGNNLVSWRALELLAEVPASRLGCHHPKDVSVFLRNLIPLVKIQDLDPTSDNYYAGPLQSLVEKAEVDLCQTIARRVDQDRIINILLELSACQVSPRCPLQANTVGWALMMNAMQQHILTNSRQYWELSHAHSLKESGEPNHSAMTPHKVAFLHDVASRMIRGNRKDVAANMKKELGVTGPGVDDFVFVDVTVRALKQRKSDDATAKRVTTMTKRTTAEQDASNEVDAAFYSEVYLDRERATLPSTMRVERRNLRRSELTLCRSVPESLMRAMLSCDPASEFIVRVNVGAWSWVYVVARDVELVTEYDANRLAFEKGTFHVMS